MGRRAAGSGARALLGCGRKRGYAMLSEANKAALCEEGFCVLPGVLSPDQAAQTRAKLEAAAEESRRRGIATYVKNLDPNDANVRVFNLLDLDPVFQELIAHPMA